MWDAARAICVRVINGWSLVGWADLCKQYLGEGQVASCSDSYPKDFASDRHIVWDDGGLDKVVATLEGCIDIFYVIGNRVVVRAENTVAFLEIVE